MRKKAQQKRTEKLLATRRQRLARWRREAPAVPAEPVAPCAYSQAGATLEILTEGCTTAKALEVGGNVLGWCEKVLTDFQRDPRVGPIACQAGCWWCCALAVSVSAPEALVLAVWLRAHLAPEVLATLTAAMQARADEVAGLTIEEHSAARLPCALLQDGRCMAYEARPLACRAWHSRDAQACAVGYEQPFAAKVTLVQHIDEIGQARRDGLEYGCALAQVDTERYELHSA